MAPIRPPSPKNSPGRKLHRSILALALVVTVSACSTTQVARPSQELSKMNVSARNTRSVVTLTDGRQLDVEKLHVGLHVADGRLRRERRLDVEGKARSDWEEVGGDPLDIAFPSDEIVRVELTTARGKGGVIGGLAGLVVGFLVGSGVGLGVGAALQEDCRRPFPGFGRDSCEDSNVAKVVYAWLIGSVVGALLLGGVGVLIGVQGVDRTYEFVAAPDAAAMSDASTSTPHSITSFSGSVKPRSSHAASGDRRKYGAAE
jgi:hypothetical protein